MKKKKKRKKVGRLKKERKGLQLADSQKETLSRPGWLVFKGYFKWWS